MADNEVQENRDGSDAASAENAGNKQDFGGKMLDAATESNTKEQEFKTEQKGPKFLRFLASEKMKKVGWILEESSGSGIHGDRGIGVDDNGCIIGFFRLAVVLVMLVLLSLAQIPFVKKGLNSFARWLKPHIDKIPERFYSGFWAKIFRRKKAGDDVGLGMNGVGILRQTLFMVVSMPAVALTTILVGIIVAWLLTLTGLVALVIPFAIVDLAATFIVWLVLGLMFMLYSTYYIRFVNFDFDNPNSDDGLQLACAILGSILSALITIIGVVLMIVFVHPLFKFLSSLAHP